MVGVQDDAQSDEETWLLELIEFNRTAAGHRIKLKPKRIIYRDQL